MLNFQIRSSLQEHFGACGGITRISIPKDFESGYAKGSVPFFLVGVIIEFQLICLGQLLN